MMLRNKWYALFLCILLGTACQSLSPTDVVDSPAEGVGVNSSGGGIASQPEAPNNFTEEGSFPSMDVLEGGKSPPDPHMAVGPNHVVAVVNRTMEVYDKQGNTLFGPQPLPDLMPTCTAGDGTLPVDPEVQYDQFEDRFVITAIAKSPGINQNGKLCIAVTVTSDPSNNQWHAFAFDPAPDDVDPTTSYWVDFPKTGISHNAVYVSTVFKYCQGDCQDVVRLFAFEKASLYAGQQNPKWNYHTLGTPGPQPTYRHLVPLHIREATIPDGGIGTLKGDYFYFAGVRTGTTATVTIFTWFNPFDENQLTQWGTLNLDTATNRVSVPVVDAEYLGGTQLLDANDHRLSDFEYYDGNGWIIQTIGCQQRRAVKNCVRWAKIDLGPSLKILQAGVFGDSTSHHLFADLAVNRCGQMAFGYTKTNSAIYPGSWYTGFEGGNLIPEVELKAGEVTYRHDLVATLPRWGDYTEMTIDPDGVTFWYIGEYSKDLGDTDENWGTYIGAFTLSGC